MSLTLYAINKCMLTFIYNSYLKLSRILFSCPNREGETLLGKSSKQ